MSAITNGISQSQINLYRNCPYAYKLKYVDGLAAMVYTTEYMDVGKYIHDAIDTYYKNSYDINVTSPETIFNSVYSTLREIWDTTLLAKHLQKAYVCLQNFAMFDFDNILEKGTEPKAEANYRYDDFRIRVDYFREQPLMLGDFKSSTVSTVSYGYKMQAAIYLYVLRNELGKEITDFYIWYLYPNETKILKWDKLQETLKEAKQYRNDIMNSFKTGIFEKKPRTKSSCKYCDYRYYCKRNF